MLPTAAAATQSSTRASILVGELHRRSSIGLVDCFSWAASIISTAAVVVGATRVADK
jgi:hypothetical protein